jgi:hypothetical protein
MWLIGAHTARSGHHGRQRYLSNRSTSLTGPRGGSLDGWWVRGLTADRFVTPPIILDLVTQTKWPPTNPGRFSLQPGHSGTHFPVRGAAVSERTNPTGYFFVDRAVFDHEIFADEPFTEREAYVLR